MWCRRQWHGLGTVFGPSRGSVRLYHECTWLASIWVVVARVRRAITQGRCSRGGWAGVWGGRRRRRLSRGGSDVWCVREPSTVTLRGRGRTSVAGASVTVTRRKTSAITLGSPVGTSILPITHFLFPCLEYGAVSIVRYKLRVEEGKYVGEGCRAPAKTVIRRITVTAAATILHTSLTAGALSEEGCPQGQFGVESMVCYSTNDRIILVIEGPDAITDAEGVPARVNR